MAKHGWILRESLLVERACADRKSERLAGLAEELVRKRVEAILTADFEETVAALAAHGRPTLRPSFRAATNC